MSGIIRVEFTCEEPPGAGPVPALRAGAGPGQGTLALPAGGRSAVPDRRTLRTLHAAAQDADAGALLTDAEGRRQWLVSCWRTGRIQAALDEYGGASLGGLLGPLHPAEVAISTEPGQPPPWLDCDTSDDLAAAMAYANPDRREGTR